MEFAIALIVAVVTFAYVHVNVATEREDDTEMQKLARIAAGKMIAAVIAFSSMYMGLMLLHTYFLLEN